MTTLTIHRGPVATVQAHTALAINAWRILTNKIGVAPATRLTPARLARMIRDSRRCGLTRHDVRAVVETNTNAAASN